MTIDIHTATGNARQYPANADLPPPAEGWERIEGPDAVAQYEARRDAILVTLPPPPAQAAPLPDQVSNQQLRLALIEAGIFPSAILAKLNSMPAGAEKEKALAAWEYANHFRRDHPLVDSLAAQIGLSAAQVDDLFRLADTLG
jgi:hypothetical protein